MTGERMNQNEHDDIQAVERLKDAYARMDSEIGKVIVGHSSTVEGVIICLLADGHALIEGVPGLGKTLLVRTLSQTLDLTISRIQFTPDLMPADITGTDIIMESEQGNRKFSFQPALSSPTWSLPMK